MKRVHLMAALASFCIAPAAAAAQEQPPAPSTAPATDPGGELPAEPHVPNDGALPAPRSDTDPAPEVASPTTKPAVAKGAIVQQAGVGGPVGYGRAGVLELGGSAGFTSASDLTVASVTPSFGWFVADNVRLSALLGFSYIEVADQNATMVSGLLEPSYHLPFTRVAFGFLGLGVGGSHVQDLGMGFAVAPRVGANLLIGRSGVLTPALSYQYTTHDPDDTMLVQASSALLANIGYTIMW